MQAPFALGRFFPGAPAHGDPQPKLGHQPLCLGDIGFNLLKNALWHGPNKGYRRNSRAYKNGVPDVEYISHERALRIVDELEAVGWHESAGQVAQARGDGEAVSVVRPPVRLLGPASAYPAPFERVSARVYPIYRARLYPSCRSSFTERRRAFSCLSR